MKNFILISIALLTLSGCKESDVQAWVEKTDSLRVASELASQNFSFREDEQRAFKKYYGELASKVVTIKEDAKLQKGFNQFLAKQNLETLCSKILSKRVLWVSLSNNCQTNGFFLCAEEVAAYPEVMKTLRDLLTPDLQKRFDQTESCKAAIE